MQGQFIGQINKYLLPKQKNDEFRIIRTAKGTSLQNSQKYVLSYTYKTQLFQSTRLYIILKTALLLRGRIKLLFRFLKN